MFRIFILFISMAYSSFVCSQSLHEKVQNYFENVNYTRDDQQMMVDIRAFLQSPMAQERYDLYGKARVLEAEYLRFLGDYIRAKDIVSEIDDVELLSPIIRTRILIIQASAAYELGEYEQFSSLAEQALAAAYDSDSIFIQAKALSFVAAAKARIGQYEEAVQSVKDTLEYVDYIQDKRQRAEILSALPATYAFLNNIEAGLDVQQQVIELYHDIDLVQRLEHAYFGLGRLYFSASRFNDSYNAHQRAYEFAQEFGQVEQIARASYGLGIAASRLGLLGEAEQYLSMSLPIFTNKGFKRKMLLNKIELAHVFRLQQRNADATFMLQESWEALDSTDMIDAQARALKMLAELSSEQDDWYQAYKWLSSYSDVDSRRHVIELDRQAALMTAQQLEQAQKLEQRMRFLEAVEPIDSFQIKSEQRRLNLFMLAVIVLLIAFCFFIWWRYKRIAQYWQTYQSVNPITGIQTEGAMYSRLDEEFQRFELVGQSFSMALLSIREAPNLKQLLSRKALQDLNLQVIQILCDIMPPYAVLGHHHNDQYMVLLPSMTEQQAEALVTPLADLMSIQQFALLGEKNLSLAFGCAEVTPSDTNMLSLIMRTASKLEQDEMFSRHMFGGEEKDA